MQFYEWDDSPIIGINIPKGLRKLEKCKWEGTFLLLHSIPCIWCIFCPETKINWQERETEYKKKVLEDSKNGIKGSVQVQSKKKRPNHLRRMKLGEKIIHNTASKVS